MSRWACLVLAIAACGASTKHARTAHREPSAGDRPPSEPAAREEPPAEAAPADNDEQQFCVDETNRYRALHQKPPVARSSALETCAAAAAANDAAKQRPHDHFMATSGCDLAFAENEIPWWPAEYAGSLHEIIRQGLAQMYAEGPGGGHYENMLGDYTELGCGILESGGTITIVQDYR